MVDRKICRDLLIIGLILLQPVLFGSINSVEAAMTVSFVPSTATTGTCRLAACMTQFTATVTGTDSYPITVSWDWGNDGNVEKTCTINSGNKCPTTFVLNVTGTFPVKVIATDHNGMTGETMHDVIVTPSPPVAIVPSIVVLSPALRIGDVFSVNILVGNSTNPVNDLDGWEITLSYDPKILTAIGPSCGALGSPPCTAAAYGANPPFDTYSVYRSPSVDDAQGQITLGATFAASFPDVGPSGFGNLSKVDFAVRARGSSPIHLASVALRSVAITTIQAISPSATYDGCGQLGRAKRCRKP